MWQSEGVYKTFVHEASGGRRLMRVPGRFALERQQGFSLIEVMIVVVIIGILASIAYPSYTRYVERAQVSDGQSGLLQAAQVMERCYTANMRYENCTAPSASPEGYYSIDFASGEPTATTYILEATGEEGRVADSDAVCHILTINHRGQRGPADCW